MKTEKLKELFCVTRGIQIFSIVRFVNTTTPFASFITKRLDIRERKSSKNLLRTFAITTKMWHVTSIVSMTYIVISILTGIIAIKPTCDYYQLQKNNDHAFWRKRLSHLGLIKLISIIFQQIVVLPMGVLYYGELPFISKQMSFIADTITNSLYPPTTHAILYICLIRFGLYLLFCLSFALSIQQQPSQLFSFDSSECCVFLIKMLFELVLVIIVFFFALAEK